MRSRRLFHVLALTMQLCMAWMSVSALLHSDDDDVLCNPVLVLHDHNAHHVGAAKTAASVPEHCFICHNLSLRSLVASAITSAPALAAQWVAPASFAAAAKIVVARQPARAPPLV